MERIYKIRSADKLFPNLTYFLCTINYGVESMHVSASFGVMVACPTWLGLIFENSARADVFQRYHAKVGGTQNFTVTRYGKQELRCTPVAEALTSTPSAEALTFTPGAEALTSAITKY